MNEVQKKIAEAINKNRISPIRFPEEARLINSQLDVVTKEISDIYEEEDKKLTEKYQGMLHEYPEWEFEPFIPFNPTEFKQIAGGKE